MSVRGRLLLWLGCVFVASRPAVAWASDDGLVISLNNETLPSRFPSNITKLTLSHNLIQMSEADITALENYTELTELYLDGNKIAALPSQAFGSLSKLRILSVSDNSIGRVDPDAFKGLGDLKTLDLSRNQIRSLPLGVFAGLSSLGNLSLQGNGLQSLENDTFADLVQLELVQLAGNPWNCSCAFLHLIQNSGVKISPDAICASPEDKAGKTLQDRSLCFPGPIATRTPLDVAASSPQMTDAPTLGQNNSADSSKKAAPGAGEGEAAPLEGNTWRFLAGVVATVLCTSALLVCAVKSPSWYKRLFNYRHRRLCEEEPGVFATGRYSDLSVNTERTDVSAQELEAELDDDEDDDGYIEDRYIETVVYMDTGEA